MKKRFTVALRICVSCRNAFGVGMWPWNGERFTRTHGLCKACFEQLDASFDDERAAAARPPAPAPPSEGPAYVAGAGI